MILFRGVNAELAANPLVGALTYQTTERTVRYRDGGATTAMDVHTEYGLPVEEKFLAVFALEILRRNDVLAYAPTIKPAQAKRLGFLQTVAEPQELIRRAAKHAPRNATVAIFPQGGVTYPVTSGE